MQVGRKLKDTFRARDELGHEYDVKVYVEASSGNTTGGGSWEVEGFASATATVLSGPFKGQTFQATWVGGDVYQLQTMGAGPKITRVR
jgi:hypothetical protein